MLNFIKKCRRRLSIIGLDLGSSQAHWVEATYTEQSLKLLNLGVIHYPDDIFSAGTVIQPQRLVTALKPILVNCKAHHVALHISDKFIISKTLAVPAELNAEELEAYVTLEMNQQLTGSFTTSFFDFALLRKNNHQPELNDIVCATCPNSIISSRINALKTLGLMTILVGVEHYLLANLQTYSGQKNSTKLNPFLKWKITSDLANKQLLLLNNKFTLAAALAIEGLTKWFI